MLVKPDVAGLLKSRGEWGAVVLLSKQHTRNELMTLAEDPSLSQIHRDILLMAHDQAEGGGRPCYETITYAPIPLGPKWAS
jgi:hypothetical protein